MWEVFTGPSITPLPFVSLGEQSLFAGHPLLYAPTGQPGEINPTR